MATEGFFRSAVNAAMSAGPRRGLEALDEYELA